VEKLEKIKYILEQALYFDSGSGKRAYSFNVKIHNLVLNEEEKKAAYQLIQNQDLNNSLWQELSGLMADFEKETGIKAYTVGRNRGHLILKSHGEDGIPVYTEAMLMELPDEQLDQVFEVLKRFRKLFEDMFLVFKKRMGSLQN
jgi:isopropylmalate/homocitrate/citramalate synthase